MVVDDQATHLSGLFYACLNIRSGNTEYSDDNITSHVVVQADSTEESPSHFLQTRKTGYRLTELS